MRDTSLLACHPAASGVHELKLQLMFSAASLVFVWLFGILAGHLAAIWFDKQEVMRALLKDYVDISIHAATEWGKHTAVFLTYIGDICVVLLDYIGSGTQQILDYIGSSLVATITFSGASVAGCIRFSGSTAYSFLNYSGVMLSNSLTYAGSSLSATILFALDVMEKLAHVRVFYTFVFILSLFVLFRYPSSLQRGLENVVLPVRDGVVEVWRVGTRAVFIVWSHTKLAEVLKLLIVIVLLMHLKNAFFC